MDTARRALGTRSAEATALTGPTFRYLAQEMRIAARTDEHRGHREEKKMAILRSWHPRHLRHCDGSWILAGSTT